MQAKEAQLQQRIDALEKRLEKTEKTEKKSEEKKETDAAVQLPATLPLPLPGKGAFPALTLTPAEAPERVLGILNGQEIYVSQGMVLHRDPPKPAKAKKGAQP